MTDTGLAHPDPGTGAWRSTRSAILETIRFGRARAAHSRFRRPSSDPTLGEGIKAPTTPAWTPTTPAWAPTPTLSNPRTLDALALVVGEVLIDTSEDEPGSAQPPAGSGVNVAVGLARLGRFVELMTSFGADTNGAHTRSYLEREHVEVAPGSDRASRTSTVRARPGEDDRATWVDMLWEPPAARPEKYPHVVHIGTAGALESGAHTVAGTIAAYRPGATITYDPGVCPDLMGSPEDIRAQVEGLVTQADVVKASTRDLDWLYPDEDPARVARRWLGSGPGVVVVSGGEFLWAMNALGEVVTAPGHKADDSGVVSPDDALMAALIDALWSSGLLGVAARKDLHTLVRGSLQALVDHASAAAALTASRPAGGPPTRAELDTWRGTLGIVIEAATDGRASPSEDGAPVNGQPRT